MTGLVLLTGATGFVGRQVLRALHKSAVPVRAVVREGSQSRLKPAETIDKIIATPDLFSESSQWWADV
jgi:uncharacterized protein YbjT (DUF2867 family)